MTGKGVRAGVLVRALHGFLTLAILAATLWTDGTLVSAQETAGVQILQNDGRGLRLSLHVPAYDLTPDALQVDGLGHSQEPGIPPLPVRSFLVLLPPGATPVLQWQGEASVLAGTAQLGERKSGFFEETRLLSAWIPDQPAQWEELGILRGRRVARLSLFPFQYQEAGGRLRWHPQLTVHVDYGNPQPEHRTGADFASPTDPMRSGLEAQAVNGAVARAWPLESLPDLSPAEAGATHRILRMVVDRTGLYALTYTDLEAAGLSPGSLSPGDLQLTNQGNPVALYLDLAQANRFQPGDRLLFYGEPMDTPYTGANVYWLENNATDPPRMAVRDVAPAADPPPLAQAFVRTAHFEQQTFYLTQYPPSAKADHWFWNFYRATVEIHRQRTFDFNLPGVVVSEPATVTLALQGTSSDPLVSPDHRAQVSINGQAVGTVEFDGAVALTRTLAIPAQVLQEGSNRLALYAPNDTGAVRDDAYLDWFDVTYSRAYTFAALPAGFAAPDPGPWRYQVTLPASAAAGVSGLFDVTDPAYPVRLVGYSTTGAGLAFVDNSPAGADGPPAQYLAVDGYLAPASLARYQQPNLRAPAQGADWLLIHHGDFRDQAYRLATHRTSQGLRTAVVDVQYVYDQFNDGILHPAAIRDFLQYAYAHWPAPAPTYLLLLGDGSDDPRHYSSVTPQRQTYIPPFMAYVDPFSGLTASDNQFVLLHGDDSLPDLFVGRLPVNSPAEAAAVVDKLIQYDQRRTTDTAFARPLLFVADNPDNAGQFHALSDEAIAVLPPSQPVERLYLGANVSGNVEAQERIVEAFNRGAPFVNYVGHASETVWAFENIFSDQQLDQLRPPPQYSILLPMTCREGSFHSHTTDALSELLVRLPNSGAVASWAPSGAGVSTGHQYLHRGFYTALFDETTTKRMGPLTLAGQLTLLQEGPAVYHFMLDTYNLLGDPATRSPSVRGHHAFLPFVRME